MLSGGLLRDKPHVSPYCRETFRNAQAHFAALGGAIANIPTCLPTPLAEAIKLFILSGDAPFHCERITCES